MKRVPASMALPLAVLGALAVLPATPAAAETGVQLRNAGTNECLDLISNGSYGNGNWIGHYGCNGLDNQKWRFEYRGQKNVCQHSDNLGRCNDWRTEDVYRIRPVPTNKCVDLDAKGTESGTRVHQWDCLNDDSQLWYYRDTPGGRIIYSVWVQNERYVTKPYALQPRWNDPAKVEVWAANGQALQTWQITS